MNIARQTVLDLISAASPQSFLSVLIFFFERWSLHPPVISASCVCFYCLDGDWDVAFAGSATPGDVGLGLGVGLRTGGDCLMRSGLHLQSNPVPGWSSGGAAAL